MELNSEFTIWHGANYGGRAQGPKDLHEFMDKEFGRQKNQCWVGCKIKYDNYEEEADYNNYVVEEEVGEIDENEL